MALEQLVNGMTGQQLANTIKNNFEKVLDVESAENKAENAGKALKTDYDATRYVEMELADGTPIRMRWDVFCQAIASVVAEQIGVNQIGPITLEPGAEYDTGIPWNGLIEMSVENSGKSMIVCSEAYVLTDANIIHKGEEFFSVNLSESNRDCMNKKETNGTIVLKNNRSIQRRYRLKFR